MDGAMTMANRTNDIVLDYFEQLKIRPSKNRGQFMSMIALKHGKAIATEIDRLVSSRADGEDKVTI